MSCGTHPARPLADFPRNIFAAQNVEQVRTITPLR